MLYLFEIAPKWACRSCRIEGSHVTIFPRNSAGTVRGSGVFSRSTQGCAALFWRAVQCRLMLRSMVFRKGGVLYLFRTILERPFQ